MSVRSIDGWRLREEHLEVGIERWRDVAARADGWLAAPLPCDVHAPLVAAGRIAEPLVGTNAASALWIEERSWWFTASFDVPAGDGGGDAVELVFETLDGDADVVLNGRHLGSHRNAFRPFVAEVRELLQPRDNRLVVRLTCGAERVSVADLAGIGRSVQVYDLDGRGDPRRAALRKPQYVYGWDFTPRLATCGITGAVRLEAHRGIAIRHARAFTRSVSEDRAAVGAELEVENLHPIATRDAAVTISLSLGGRSVAVDERDVLLRSGRNYLDVDLPVERPALWWPNGMGGQPLHDLEVAVRDGGGTLAGHRCRMGIRTLALDLAREGGGRRFALRVNGRRMNCRGADWVPADALYARADRGTYVRLLDEAAAAHMNMLRVWGGAIYERGDFYDLCDERGLLLWHDFMFACALVPDHLEEYRREVERELDYQLRRLGGHPCIGLWSGNNENQWVWHSYWRPTNGIERFGGAAVYNRIAPETVRRHTPEIPYWNGSPYGGAEPNDRSVGDRHHWVEATMGTDPVKRIAPAEYDGIGARFVTEYGFFAPCRRSVAERFLGLAAGAAIDRTSPAWRSHVNWFDKGAVDASIARHYHREPAGLDYDRYCLLGQLCQMQLYEYSLESLRADLACSGALFWMLADMYGETGWTVLDVERTRKAGYYGVRRALAPVKLVVRRPGPDLVATAINDGPGPVSFGIECGFAPWRGACRVLERGTVSLAASERAVVLRVADPPGNPVEGAWFARATDPVAGVLPGLLRRHEVRGLELPRPRLRVTPVPAVSSAARARPGFTVTADVFAHAVHFGLADEVRLSDEYFDLLPGESRTVFVEEGLQGLPHDLAARCVVTGGDGDAEAAVR